MTNLTTPPKIEDNYTQPPIYIEQCPFYTNLKGTEIIKDFFTLHDGSNWVISVETMSDKRDVLKDKNRCSLNFMSLDAVGEYLSSIGITEFRAFISGGFNHE